MIMTQTKLTKFHCVLLTWHLALPILSSDIYLPSLYEMGNFFQASQYQVQLTLSLYFLCFSVAQLIYGPLSDWFGRKPLLLISLSIYTMGTFFCILAPSMRIFCISQVMDF